MDQLHALIHRMDKAEKIFFRKQVRANTRKADTATLQLFKILIAQPEYDEDKLLRDLPQPMNRQKLAVLKNYLQSKLLDSLVSIKARETKTRRVQQLIHLYDILSRKGLYKYAEKMLARARSWSEKIEDPILHLTVLEGERKAAFHQSTKKLDRILMQNMAETRETLDKMRYDQQLSHLYYRAFSILSRAGAGRLEKDVSEVEKIKHDVEVLGVPQKLRSFGFRIHWHSFYETYYLLHADRESSLLHSRQIVVEYENHPELTLEKQHGYINALNNLLNSTIRLGNASETDQTLVKMADLMQSKDENRYYIESRYLHFNFLRHLWAGNYREAWDFYTEVKATLDRHSENYSQPKFMMILIDLSHLYFGLEELEMALLYNNRVLNEFTNVFFDDFISEAHVLHVMIHYAMGNFDYLTSRVSSLQRTYRKKKGYQAERNFLQLMAKLIAIPDAPHRQKVLQSGRQILIELSSNPREKFQVEELRLIPWIDAQLNNDPLPETIREYRINHNDRSKSLTSFNESQ